MYEAIDLVELKRMADLAEAEPDHLFDMTIWKGSPRIKCECGTAGCLIGTWAKHTMNDALKVDWDNDFKMFIPVFGNENYEGAVSARFGTPHLVARFLFTSHIANVGTDEVSEDALNLSKKEAVARLRKYIRWVERKRALFQDHEDLMRLSRRDRLARLLNPRREELSARTVLSTR